MGEMGVSQTLTWDLQRLQLHGGAHIPATFQYWCMWSVVLTEQYVSPGS